MSPSPRSGERGVTLPELLIAITVSTLIIGAMAMALNLAFRTTTGTADRFTEAHDAELVSTYFVPDAQSSTRAGQTIDTGCAEQGADDAVRFSSPTFAAGYRLTGTELTRWSCEGGRRSTHVVARELRAVTAWSTGGHQVAMTLVATSGHSYSMVGTQRTGTVELPPPPTENAPPRAVIAVQCTLRACTFDAGGSTDADGGIVAYRWDFGDGSTATTSSAAHTYALNGTYTVGLTVTDDDGASGSATKAQTVIGNVAPTASITVSCTKQWCHFDASTSTDPDGSISAYAWTFGDGATAGTATADHAYGASGTYTVGLTVTDDRGDTGTAGRSLPIVVNVPPSALMSASCTGRACTVNGASSSDSDGTIASWSWSWGDGTANGAGATAGHTYTSSGSRTIVLTVTDDNGVTATASRTVNLNLAPAASFTVDACNLATCAVNAAASGDSDGSIVSYAWTWSDGTANGSGPTASHTYTAAGSRTITLTVTDDDGATATTTRTVTPPVLVVSSKATWPSYSVTVTWNAAALTANTKVDVYRNGSVVASNITNSGTYTRSSSSRTQVEGNYMVCDRAAPNRCTNTVVVSIP